MAPEDNPADDLEPTEEEWEAFEKHCESNHDDEITPEEIKGAVPESSAKVEAITFESDDGAWVVSVTYTDGTFGNDVPFAEACEKLGLVWLPRTERIQ
jgi:hypothetical protein